MVSVSPCVDQDLDDIDKAFSGSIKQWRLAKVVNLVWIASLLNEERSKLCNAISSDIKQTRLVESVQLAWIALAYFDEVLGHLNGLFIILDLNCTEQSILIVILFINQKRNIIWLD